MPYYTFANIMYSCFPVASVNDLNVLAANTKFLTEHKNVLSASGMLLLVYPYVILRNGFSA